MGFFLTLLLLVVTLGLAWRYLGSYMAAVFDGRVHFLGWLERPIYRMLGTSPEHEQTWKRYAGALVVFSGVSILFTYVIIRIQGHLPLNPQHLGGVGSGLSWNTSVSFVTNTNWQNYAGETTMSYFSQIGALTVQQFVSPAVGIVAAIVLVRGFARRNAATIGNFWVDMVRCLFYVLLPMAFLAGVVFVGEGAVQTLAGTISFHDALNGVVQTIPRGPVGFMEAIKQLGTNGGGFFNQNGATTFENPTGLTNFLSIFLLLSIPVALTYTFGKMVGSIKHGFALLSVMIILFPSGWASPPPPRARTTRRSRPRASTRPWATWRARTSASAFPRPPSTTSRPPRPRRARSTRRRTPTRRSAGWDFSRA